MRAARACLAADGAQQGFGHAKGAVGHFAPEVQILVEMIIGSGGVADDAEARKGMP